MRECLFRFVSASLTLSTRPIYPQHDQVTSNIYMEAPTCSYDQQDGHEGRTTGRHGHRTAPGMGEITGPTAGSLSIQEVCVGPRSGDE